MHHDGDISELDADEALKLARTPELSIDTLWELYHYPSVLVMNTAAVRLLAGRFPSDVWAACATESDTRVLRVLLTLFEEDIHPALAANPHLDPELASFMLQCGKLVPRHPGALEVLEAAAANPAFTGEERTAALAALGERRHDCWN